MVNEDLHLVAEERSAIYKAKMETEQTRFPDILEMTERMKYSE